METNTQEVAKKLWHLVRVIFFMLRKEISKAKIMADLHLMLKRGNKLANKAIGHLTFHNHNYSSSFGCRSNDAISFVSPKGREYEFSCSNSPVSHYNFNLKRKHHYYNYNPKKGYNYKYGDVSTVATVQKVLEMLNNSGGGEMVEASPLIFPGFGRSPMVRQLRITDSPFPLKDEGDSQQVDKEAEEFIKKFYKDLKSQKITSYLESPCHDSMWWKR